jgi:hypothetical protein
MRPHFAAAALVMTAVLQPAQAQDCNGDGVPDAEQVGAQGLTAQYYANREWAGEPVATRVELGDAGGFDLDNWPLPAGVPEDQFSVRWTGSIQFNQTNLFQFRVTSDDGYRLYLDGVLIGSSNSVGQQVVPAEPIEIAAGAHYIRVELREDFGNQRMRLERKTAAATGWNIVANTNFRAGADLDGNGVLDLCDSGDCNRNALPDALDIAADPSLDCNGNGVLDGCEDPALDCDRNGLPDSCEPTLRGLVGQYYATDDFSGPVAAKRLDASGPLGLDFNVTNAGNDWQPPGVPTDHFSVRWTGTLVVPETRSYDFQMQSDDQATLSVDGVLLFGSNTGTEERGPFLLEAGERLVVLTLREFGGDQRMRLRWRPSGTPEWTALPGDLYRPSFDADGDGIADVCQTGDCDGDLVPDGFELERGLATDCDSNGVLDACDIAAGDADDCNDNGVSDACEATVDGLFGRYYPRLGSSSPKDPYRPGPLAASRRDPNIAFPNGSWMPAGAPEDGLIVIWTGTVTTPAESGLYRFRSDTDDGCRLVVDGTTVVDRWLNDSGVGEGSIELAANTPYDFRFEFHEGNGGQFAFLEWAPPSAGAKGGYAVVPTEAFRMATPDCNANGRPDDCDIADGTLPDPGAGIPDPCGAAAPCPSDLDGDGEVNAADLAILLGAWGTGSADLSGDGNTDAADLAVLLGAWGACP